MRDGYYRTGSGTWRSDALSFLCDACADDYRSNGGGDCMACELEGIKLATYDAMTDDGIY
jgi:hypothetical protein